MNRSVKIQASPRGALRSGYSLLELMIALSLLSVLVVLVWSLLSTFTTAESRGERAAQRIQLLRGVRQVLQADLEQAFVKGKKRARSRESSTNLRVSSGAPSSFEDMQEGGESVAAKSSETGFAIGVDDEGTFDGDTMGFTCSVYRNPSPTVWLNSLMADPLEMVSLGNDTVDSAEQRMIVVRYELEMEVWGDEEVAFLSRKTSFLDSPRDSLDEENSDPNAMLDVADLYRIEEESAGPPDSQVEPELRFGPLSNARFRYHDGQVWSSSAAGSLPVAIEMSFDMPTRGLRPPEPEPELEGDPMNEESPVDLLTDSSLNEWSEEPLLTGDDLYGDDALEDSREFRIVVYVRLPDRKDRRKIDADGGSDVDAITDGGASR